MQSGYRFALSLPRRAQCSRGVMCALVGWYLPASGKRGDRLRWGEMGTFLARLGRGCASRPWRVLSAWLVVVGIVGAAAYLFGDDFKDDYSIPGLPSTAGYDLLTEKFSDVSGTEARVVVHSDHGPVPDDELTALHERLVTVPGVSVVSDPRVSSDGDTVLYTVVYRTAVTDFKGSEGVDALRTSTEPTRDAGLDVALGGEVPESFSAPGSAAEVVGIVAALIILLFAFGSVAAAGLPLAVAFVGVGAGTAAITVLAGFTDVSPTAPTIATMVGVGVGIDYALLLATRFREGLERGLSTIDAAAEATETAGASVLTAGMTVLVSLLGLRVAGLPVISSFGYATFLMVVFVMTASVTLVPALCAMAGHRIQRRWHFRRPRVRRQLLTERWTRSINAHPAISTVLALAFLLACAAPALGLRTWPQDASSQPTSNTTRVAYDLIAHEFGEGASGPLTVALDIASTTPEDVDSTLTRVRELPGIALVTPAIVNNDRTVAVFNIEPTIAPQEAGIADIVYSVRESLPTSAYVTGFTAASVDIVDRLADRIWLVVGLVVALSLILLTVVFRSPVVAIKAALMNLLSVAAAYGLLVVVFQRGWGATLLGLNHTLPVSTWVPILVFTILFGLSMDYEVFMLARIRERWLATRDMDRSVVDGLAATGPVIGAGGAIMIAVFAGFAFDSDITVKMMGFGMAIAVLLDITIVRFVLVPATMTLLGELNWWAPSRLRRKVDIDAAMDITT